MSKQKNDYNFLLLYSLWKSLGVYVPRATDPLPAILLRASLHRFCTEEEPTKPLLTTVKEKKAMVGSISKKKSDFHEIILLEK